MPLRRPGDEPWITQKQASEILDVHPTRVPVVARNHKIRVRDYGPNTSPRYSREDCLRVAKEAVTAGGD